MHVADAVFGCILLILPEYLTFSFLYPHFNSGWNKLSHIICTFYLTPNKIKTSKYFLLASLQMSSQLKETAFCFIFRHSQIEQGQKSVAILWSRNCSLINLQALHKSTAFEKQSYLKQSINNLLKGKSVSYI